jgi:N-acetylmuramoyl-L-alanine amidase
MSKIYIDAGHGNSDPGAVGVGGRREADDNLRLALELNTRLTALGFATKMTRTANAFTPVNRSAAANDWGADLLLSLHRNAFKNSGANGFETWTVIKYTATTDKIAQAIQRRVVAAGKWTNRGVKRGSPSGVDFGLLAGAKMPAVLAEYGFVTNPQDNARFDDNFAEIAAATVSAIVEVFGQPAPPITPPPTLQTYTVVRGDTLTGIARKFGVSLAALIAANPQIKDINVIHTGDKIFIPR